jgi:hypothetical protein
MAPSRNQTPIRYRKAIPAAAQGRHQSGTRRQRLAIARRATKAKERRAIFAAKANANAGTSTSDQ